MSLQTNYYTNWGKNIFIKTKIYYPENIDELKKLIKKKNFIIAGNQRSFGDAAFNKKNIISLKKFNKIKYFDTKKGLIEIESGKLLIDILKIVIKNGWFVPVTPGTKYVTFGGMISNNVHGKNSKNNYLRNYITEITLINGNNKIIKCSKKKNRTLFDAVIGGYGLCGIILSAKIQLKKINSQQIDQKIIQFKNYEELKKLFLSNKSFEYSVAWIEKVSKDSISGLMYLGSHCKKNNNLLEKIRFGDRKMKLFEEMFLRLFTQNYFTIKIINFFYKKLKFYFQKKNINFNNFFYPQDKFINFNKIYSKGFFQTQFLVSTNQIQEVFNKIHNFFLRNRVFSTFIILKQINEKGKNIDFTGKGISISMDIPINEKYEKTVKFLNKLFIEHKIKINFSKDFILKKDSIKLNNDFKKFKHLVYSFNKKKKLNSFFSNRLGLT